MVYPIMLMVRYGDGSFAKMVVVAATMTMVMAVAVVVCFY